MLFRSTYLVLNATTSQATTKQIIEKLSVIDISSVIISKIDEAATLGGTLSVLSEMGVPISYVANGQKIPDDIEPATSKKLVENLLKSEII